MHLCRLAVPLILPIFSPQALALDLGCLDEWIINGIKYSHSDIKKINNITYCIRKETVEEINDYYNGAANGDAAAKRNLAWAHSNSRAIPRNEQVEIKLWSDITEYYPGEKEWRIADNVYMCRLKLDLFTVTGKDDGSSDKCIYWLTRGAKLGNTLSMHRLARHYLKGFGTIKNYKKSFYWLNKSAFEGDTSSMYDLIFAYIRGEGALVNYSEAYSWALVFDYHAKQSTKRIYRDSYDEIIEKLERVLNGNKKMMAQERSIEISQLIKK